MTPRKRDSSLSGAYVLHAVTEGEAKDFEAQLAESEETRREVTELTGTAALLGLAVDPEIPPVSLKASIMAQLATTPQLAREPVAEASPDARFLPPAQARARARWFARPANALIAAAAAVALIVGGGVAVTAIGTSITQRAAADGLAAIYAATDSQVKRVPIESGGLATLVWAESLGSSALIVRDLDALPADKVYELWYIDAEGARPAGTFTVGPDGATWQLLGGTMAAGDTVGVTVEPHGGSPTPTTDPIVVIESA